MNEDLKILPVIKDSKLYKQIIDLALNYRKKCNYVAVKSLRGQDAISVILESDQNNSLNVTFEMDTDDNTINCVEGTFETKNGNIHSFEWHKPSVGYQDYFTEVEKIVAGLHWELIKEFVISINHGQYNIQFIKASAKFCGIFDEKNELIGSFSNSKGTDAMQYITVKIGSQLDLEVRLEGDMVRQDIWDILYKTAYENMEQLIDFQENPAK